MKLFTLFALFFFFAGIITTPTSAHEKHFIKHLPAPPGEAPKQYFEVTRPLAVTNQPPSCTLPLLTHSFCDTKGQPPVTAEYSPPAECCWTDVVLEFQAACKSDQEDRIAAVWLDGVELLRTTTPQPGSSGVFWKVSKDVTKYSSLLNSKEISLAVMLENSVNDVFTGAFDVNVTFVYYDSKGAAALGNCVRSSETVEENPIAMTVDKPMNPPVVPDDGPADSIIPISAKGEHGFWFSIQTDSQVVSKEVTIPQNAYKATVEIYATSHGNDEFWYSQPPDSYSKTNNLNAENGNGAYREVLVTIDGSLVGALVPFPVIYAGGINPLFWDPVVSIGAFDVPSYEIDLTPFLALLLDGKPHRIGFSVANSVPYWLVGGNLHLWLEQGTEKIEAGIIDTEAPKFKLELSTEFKGLDGSFKVEMERNSEYAGWVKSKKGNLTYSIKQELKLENEIKYENDARHKKMEQKIKDEVETRVTGERSKQISQIKIKRKFPLKLVTKKEIGNEANSSSLRTELENEWSVKVSGDFNSKVSNSQECSGMLGVEGNFVLSGTATMEQSYTYKDDNNCYSRKVSVADMNLIDDKANLLCTSSQPSSQLGRRLL
nr:peptide-N4-(N-acetyl-beta-glucosaminyl) asparagine amidase A-like [Ipomoea batatas]